MFQALKLLKLSRVLGAINLAGMAGRSIDNMNRAYTGIKNNINGNTNGYKTQYLNPKANYDTTIMIEGIEMENKSHINSFELLEIIKSVTHVPGMQVLITKSTVPAWKLWGRNKEIKHESDKETASPRG